MPTTETVSAPSPDPSLRKAPACHAPDKQKMLRDTLADAFVRGYLKLKSEE